ncbi:exported hypothetical protein [Nitrosotalea sinensis]|uniref:Uncharacterized protein n=1 Tax=Nitrosotalea sinensis TaxID=1499975 RepID=A0A2H1EEN2_9ARCH|nr:hypothetical protein [Candidatus Nitrosotalea sinensis]SHO43311.1 exported hypothetical protein [Candidatus Nitrosotalea sinensis]
MRKGSLAVLVVSLVVLSTIVVYSADAAGIPKKAISLASRFIESDLPTTSVFTDTANTYNAGSKQTFQGSTSGTSGISLAGISGNPSSLSTGDLWFNTAANVNAFKFFDVNSATQTIVSTTATCSNNQVLKYQSASGTWACSSFLSAAVTSINTDNTAAQFFNQVTGNTTVTNQGTGQHTIDIGPNVVTTTGNNGRQTFQKGLDFGSGQTDYFGNTGIIVRNPANTFATTIAGGAVTANRTLNLPVTTGTDTLATLGLAQIWTSNQDFGSSTTDKFGNTGIIVRNPANTFATTLAGGAVTANRTLNLPVTTGTDTLATLGLAQTFTQNNNFTNTLFVKGLSTGTIKKTTSGYTAATTDDVIDVNTTSTNPTILNLPDATTLKGKIYWIKKDDTSGNVLTIVPSNSQTIGGNATLSIFNNGGTMTIQSDGSNWLRIDRTSDDINSFRTSGSTMNRWYGAGTMTYTATTLAGVATLNAYPFVVPKTITIDAEQFEVTTSGATSACRQGIYTDNGNQQPEFLVSGSDSGSVATTATGVKTTTFGSPITLYGGNMYWLAISCKATLPTLRAIPVAAIPNILGMVSTMGAVETATGYTATYTCCTNALPSTYGTSPTINSAATSVYELLVRIKG